MKTGVVSFFSHLYKDVGAEKHLKGVVPEKKPGAVDRFTILHKGRTPDFDQVDVEDADPHGRQGV